MRLVFRIVGIVLRALTAIVLVFAILFAVNYIDAHLRPVTRADLQVAGEYDAYDASCVPNPLPNLWHPLLPGSKEGQFDYSFNREEVGVAFAQYAAMAANSYDTDTGAFDFSEATWLGWESVAFDDSSLKGGLSIDIYRKVQDGPAGRQAIVAIVFRGTRGIWSFQDHLSNLSWFVRAFGLDDQYSEARRATMAIRDAQAAWIKAQGLPYSFLVVGHSLGGGLARHVASAFPCTAAVTFDASPVTNEYLLDRPFRHQVVDIYEDDDPLTAVRQKLFPLDDYMVNRDFQYYPINVAEVGSDQHTIRRIATGLSRQALECVATGLKHPENYGAFCRIAVENIAGICSLWSAMPPGWDDLPQCVDGRPGAQDYKERDHQNLDYSVLVD